MEGAPVATRIDEAVNFDWGTGSPAPGVPADDFSARWTGKLVPAVSGKFRFGAIADDGVRVYLDGKLIAEDWTEHPPTTVTGEVSLKAGKSYDLKMEYYEAKIGAVAKLVWQPPTATAESPFAEPVKAAKQADAVVLILGLSPQLEGEEMNVREPGFLGGDRTEIGLPARQQQLLEAVARTGKPVVLVLLNGSALAVTWAKDHVPAIVDAWYPGEEGGTAIADVLFGDYNPGGRLPVTFYKSIDQLPAFTDYSMQNRTYRYFKGEPLYPFGYGLSYTTFAYSNLKTSVEALPRDGAINVTVDVKNSGTRAGDEVVQMYVRHLNSAVTRPLKELKKFTRVHLNAQESTTVNFTLPAHQLAYWNADSQRFEVEPDQIEILIGPSSADAKLKKTITVK